MARTKRTESGREAAWTTTDRGTTLVFGASGYIGSHLVPRLLRHHHRVRACARHLEVLQARQWSGVELVAADALRPATLVSALRGVRVAYYLVHSMAAGRDFGRLDLEAADHFAAAAAREGVERIVYLGGLLAPDATSEHLVSRRDTGKRLRQGSVPVTEIRAGIIVGPGSAAFEVIRDLVGNLPVMITPRWVRSKSPPIALENLLEYLVRCPEIPAMAGGIYDAAGPEILTYEQVMRQLGALIGRRPIILAVPVLTPRLSSYWLCLVTSVPTNVARALIEGLRHDFAANPAPLRELIPQRLLTFREAVEAVFAAERDNAMAARWTEGALLFRDYNPRYGFYAKHLRSATVTQASRQAIWRLVTAIGGENRYYYRPSLWTLREIIDWLAGGPGRRRGRRHPTEVRVGDMIDSWRVVGMEPLQRLTLMCGMKAPGAGVLEFELLEEQDGTRLTATTYWHPAGVWGLLYWYALLPAHRLILRGMVRAMAERAEREGAMTWETQRPSRWPSKP